MYKHFGSNAIVKTITHNCMLTKAAFRVDFDVILKSK